MASKSSGERWAAIVRRRLRPDPPHRQADDRGRNHVDQLYDLFPDRLRPIAPCYRQAFLLLEAWVEEKPGRKSAAGQDDPDDRSRGPI
ncbi:MAG: hypothetical protein ACXWUL_08405 [Caldimonas sp.]